MACMPNGMTTGGGDVQEFEVEACDCTDYVGYLRMLATVDHLTSEDHQTLREAATELDLLRAKVASLEAAIVVERERNT